eukprot:3496434-Karenia_brevis.AAC.1
MSDIDMLDALETMSPLNMVRYYRLNLAVKILCSSNWQLLNCLYLAMSSKRSWLRALIDDLSFLSANCIKFSACTDWVFHQWVSYIRPPKFDSMPDL